MARLVERMTAVGRVTNQDYREAFGVERQVATKALAALVATEALVKAGERRGAHYLPGPMWPPAE
jgi:predicted HTH transcriptional regulator